MVIEKVPSIDGGIFLDVVRSTQHFETEGRCYSSRLILTRLPSYFVAF